jgi:hypothetical protein
MGASAEAEEAQHQHQHSVPVQLPVSGHRHAPLVCAVSSPAGCGCGVLCTLRGAPCLLLPFHVLGALENAGNTKVWPGGYCSPRHRILLNTRYDGSKCV